MQVKVGFKLYDVAAGERDRREVGDEDWFIGSMLDASKALDLQRHPRFAIHAIPQMAQWKVAVRRSPALPSKWPPADNSSSHHFRLSLEEAVLTLVARDRLLIEIWKPEKGLARRERE